MSGRGVIVAANWKMNLRREEAVAYCAELAAFSSASPSAEAIVFPPFPLLSTVNEGLAGSAFGWGGQDVHPDDSGAHTGDTSAVHLLDWGCQWVLCGHSERRADHHESPELVGAKVAAAQRHGITPLLCVGETEEERNEGRMQAVLDTQLAAALPSSGSWALAYEPVWAIGTGRTATPEMAQEAHAFLRETVAARQGNNVADTLLILYGGSVKPANCETLLEQKDVDGFLVGGAGLDPNSFLDIIRRCGSVS